MPPVDRFILDRSGEPVRVNGANGPLTRARSDEILAQLKRRAPDSGIIDRHMAVEEAVAGTPLSIGNKAVLLEDGDQAYPAMLAAIHSARHSINMATYTFDDSKTGQMFADALIERRKAGVEVRIMFDGVGSIKTSPEFFKDLEAKGIEVEQFNPVNPAELLKKGPGIVERDHRKLLVVDGRIAFVGGINISSVYGTGSPGLGRAAQGYARRAPMARHPGRDRGPGRGRAPAHVRRELDQTDPQARPRRRGLLPAVEARRARWWSARSRARRTTDSIRST